MSRDKKHGDMAPGSHFLLKNFLLLSLLICFSITTTGDIHFVKSDMEEESIIVYYVDALNGDDKNSGKTKEQPLLTIQEAKKRVGAINKNMSGDIIIFVREGIFLLNTPLVFTPYDSGTNGYQIIYQAYQDEKVIISGGRKVEEWEQYQHHIYKARVPDLSGVRSLFINGVRANRAKSEHDFVGVSWWNDPEIIYSQNDGIYIDADMVKGFKNPSDLELRWNINWQDSYCKVENIIHADNGQMIIKMEQPYFHWRTSSGFDRIRPSYDIPFRIENAYELINKPGDFYFNYDTRTIYYWKRPGENLATDDVFVPGIETLIEIKGSDSANKVSNLAFKNISFKHTRWIHPDKYGVAGGQSSMVFNGVGQGGISEEAALIPGGITLEWAENISFINNHFIQMGAQGIHFKKGVHSSKITGNVFKELSAGAILLGTQENNFVLGKDPNKICRDILIKNNILLNTSRDYLGTTGIQAFYVENVIIEHNEIYSVPYQGISVGWGWEAFPIAGKNNIIRYNHLENTNNVFSDGGSIYLLGVLSGTMVDGNYIKDVFLPLRHGGVIQCDQMTAEVVISNNVLENIKGANGWLQITKSENSRDIFVNNNYTTNPQYINRGSETSIVTNTIVEEDAPPWSAKEALQIIKKAGIKSVEIQVPSGSDLTVIQENVRRLNQDMTTDIIVSLEGGIYFLSEPLVFGPADAGTNGHRVIWRNKTDELPVISGGKIIEGWKDQGNNIIAATVQENMRFRQLYVNNRKASRAKFLDGNWARVRYDPANKRFYLPRAEAEAKGIMEWEQISKVEINLVETFNSFQLILTGITHDATYTYLYIAEPAATNLGDGHGGGFGRSPDESIIYDYDIYFENAAEFLTDPGEWYLDEELNRVYYILRPGEELQDISIIAPSLDRLVTIDGSSDLVFFGLCFAHSNWLYPSDYGLITIQNLYRTEPGAGWPNNFPIPPAIEVKKSDRIQFERNIVRFTGGTGLMAWDDDLLHLSVIGNVFYETAAAAMQLGNDDKRGPKLPTEGLYRAVVRDNYLYRCGIQYGTTVIHGTFPYQIDYRNNEMTNSLTMGLNLGWGSSNPNDLFYRPIVRYNKFDSLVQQGTDASAYHTRNHSYGARIDYNWFDNMIKALNGRVLGRYNEFFNSPKFGNVYLDNDTKDHNVIGNLHTNFSSNNLDAGRDGFYIFSSRVLAPPNYIIPLQGDTLKDAVMKVAGLTPEYADIKEYIYSGSIGGDRQPSPHIYASYLVDDRDIPSVDARGNLLKIEYIGTWAQESSGGIDLGAGGYLDTYSTTSTNGDKVRLTFTGKGIEIFGPLTPDQGTVDIYINGVHDTTLDLRGNGLWQYTWYQNFNLPFGEHQIDIIKVEGEKFVFDGFKVHQSATKAFIPFEIPEYIEQGDNFFEGLIHDYESTPVGSVPEDHIIHSTQGVSASVESVGYCNNNKLVINATAEGTIQIVSVPFDIVSAELYCRLDLKALQNNKAFHLDFVDGTQVPVKLALDHLGNFRVFHGNTSEVILPYPVDSTFRVWVNMDNSNNTFSLKINEDSYGPYNYRANANPSALRIQSVGTSTGTIYLDNLVISHMAIPDTLLPLDDCETVGYKDIRPDPRQLNVFPNPSSGNVNFSFFNHGDAQQVSLTVFCPDGRKILKKQENVIPGLNVLHHDLTGLEQGIYFFELTTRYDQNAGKIIILQK